MKTIKTVWCTTTFVGFHRWVDAPDTHKFLSDFHRHVFHVRLEILVGHLDRDVEFLDMKEKLNDYLENRFAGKYFEFSCEQIAFAIMTHFEGWNPVKVTVSEDGENGATLINESFFKN